jgi:hypothetical protein
MRSMNIPFFSSLVHPVRSVLNIILVPHIFASQSVDSSIFPEICVQLITALNNAAFASNSYKNISVDSRFVLSANVCLPLYYFICILAFIRRLLLLFLM